MYVYTVSLSLGPKHHRHDCSHHHISRRKFNGLSMMQGEIQLETVASWMFRLRLKHFLSCPLKSVLRSSTAKRTRSGRQDSRLPGMWSSNFLMVILPQSGDHQVLFAIPKRGPSITTYFEVGFVTESEVQNITGSTSKDLRLGKSQTLELEDGQSTLQGWFIKLSGLSPSDLAGVRRVRIESSVGIDLQEHLLVPGKQIQQDQGLKTFNFLSKVQAEAHPSAYKPLNRHHTPCLETLMTNAKATQEDRGAREGCHDVGINGWRVSHGTELYYTIWISCILC